MEARLGDAVWLALNEKLVARLWDEQRSLLSPLKTVDGREIQVVYRGRQRWDRGPDFAGALIAWPDGTLDHGDVEVHVRSSDWRAHGHQRDPNYNGVILQVVLRDDCGGDATRQDGARVPVVALASHLAMPLESVVAALGDPIEPQLPCWREGLEFHGHLGEVLDRAGLERFETKAARFEAGMAASGGTSFRLSAAGYQRSMAGHQPPGAGIDANAEGAEQLLYAGIAEALGYTQNRAAFRRLAERVPLGLLVALRGTGGPHPDPLPEGEGTAQGGPGLSSQHSQLPSTIEAALFGTAALLPGQREMAAEEGDGYIRALEEKWAAVDRAAGIEPMPAGEWEFFRVRPANFPTRRVAALAALVERWPRDGLAERLIEIVEAGRGKPRAVARVLEGLLLGCNHASYWANHYDFGLPLRRPRDLIGRQRAAEVAVNVFLPFLAALASAREDRDLGQRVRDVYLLYPKRGDNELSRYQAVQITGIPRPRVARSACRQQGLLYIYWTWCERRRCGECAKSAA